MKKQPGCSEVLLNDNKIFVMKLSGLIFPLIFLAGFVACQNSASENEVDKAEEQVVSDAKELENSTKEYIETRKDNVERKINEKIEAIRTRLDSMDKMIAEKEAEFDSKTQAQYDKYKNSLIKLESDLEAKLKTLDNASDETFEEVKTSVDKSVDKADREMKQVLKEADEWMNNNLK